MTVTMITVKRKKQAEDGNYVITTHSQHLNDTAGVRASSASEACLHTLIKCRHGQRSNFGPSKDS